MASQTTCREILTALDDEDVWLFFVAEWQKPLRVLLLIEEVEREAQPREEARDLASLLRRQLHQPTLSREVRNSLGSFTFLNSGRGAETGRKNVSR